MITDFEQTFNCTATTKKIQFLLRLLSKNLPSFFPIERVLFVILYYFLTVFLAEVLFSSVFLFS